MITVYKIDSQGYYTGWHGDISEEDITEFDITTPVNTDETNTFYKPRWDGGKWIESWTNEEITAWKDSQHKPNTEPSTEDILLACVADLDYRLSSKEMGL